MEIELELSEKSKTQLNLYEVKEQFERYLLRHGVAVRTIAAYLNHIEKLTYYLESSAQQDIGQGIRRYLMKLRDEFASNSLYNQTISACKLLTQFLRDKYSLQMEIPVLELVSSFPFACDPTRIMELLYSNNNSLDQLRAKLIIILLRDYKVSFKLLTLCKKITAYDHTRSTVDIIIQVSSETPAKLITLKATDRELYRAYQEKLHVEIPRTDEYPYLFLSLVRGVPQPISQKALWSLLLKVLKN